MKVRVAPVSVISRPMVCVCVLMLTTSPVERDAVSLQIEGRVSVESNARERVPAAKSFVVAYACRRGLPESQGETGGGRLAAPVRGVRPKRGSRIAAAGPRGDRRFHIESENAVRLIENDPVEIAGSHIGHVGRHAGHEVVHAEDAVERERLQCDRILHRDVVHQHGHAPEIDMIGIQIVARIAFQSSQQHAVEIEAGGGDRSADAADFRE